MNVHFHHIATQQNYSVIFTLNAAGRNSWKKYIENCVKYMKHTWSLALNVKLASTYYFTLLYQPQHHSVYHQGGEGYFKNVFK